MTNPHSLPREQLLEAAERWGTPLYVTDLDTAAAAAHAWQAALPGALVAFAVKANPDPASCGASRTRDSGSRSSDRSSWRSPCAQGRRRSE